MRTVRILYSRANNNFASEPPEPVGEYRGGINFAERYYGHARPGSHAMVSAPKWEVRDVEIPTWATVSWWIANRKEIGRAVARGVDLSWPEPWVRGLLTLKPLEQYVGATLLRTRTFRSPVREATRDELVAWLDAGRRGSPFTAIGELVSVAEAKAFRAAEKKR